MDFKINTNIFATTKKIDSDTKKYLPFLSNQVLEDCNYFCKQDQKGLIDSSIIHSDLESGQLVWATEYAQKQYYLRTASRDMNANASWMWCHKAYNTFGDDWQLLLQKLIERGGK